MGQGNVNRLWASGVSLEVSGHGFRMWPFSREVCFSRRVPLHRIREGKKVAQLSQRGARSGRYMQVRDHNHRLYAR